LLNLGLTKLHVSGGSGSAERGWKSKNHVHSSPCPYYINIGMEAKKKEEDEAEVAGQPVDLRTGRMRSGMGSVPGKA
jgi:hypothetical protein